MSKTAATNCYENVELPNGKLQRNKAWKLHVKHDDMKYIIYYAGQILYQSNRKYLTIILIKSKNPHNFSVFGKYNNYNNYQR